jgi:hypothetical protein
MPIRLKPRKRSPATGVVSATGSTATPSSAATSSVPAWPPGVAPADPPSPRQPSRGLPEPSEHATTVNNAAILIQGSSFIDQRARVRRVWPARVVRVTGWTKRSGFPNDSRPRTVTASRSGLADSCWVPGRMGARADPDRRPTLVQRDVVRQLRRDPAPSAIARGSGRVRTKKGRKRASLRACGRSRVLPRLETLDREPRRPGQAGAAARRRAVIPAARTNRPDPRAVRRTSAQRCLRLQGSDQHPLAPAQPTG